MKAIALLNRTVLATLLVSASLSAFAGGGGPRGSGPYPYSGTAAMAAAAATSSTTAATTVSVASTDTLQTAASNTVSGKTRAQVRAELIEAEREGLIPANNTHYPPDAATVARNKVEFQHAENWWLAHQQSSGTAMAAADSTASGKSLAMAAHSTMASRQSNDWWASLEKLNPSVY
jgi:hypothetical protein